jgi:anti-sigma-K factor RskA
MGHVSEWLPAYALGSLDDEEVLEVSKHLEACPACQAELRGFSSLTDHLALAAPQVDPPAGLKRRILAGVAGARPAPTKAKPAGWLRLRPVWGLAGLVLVVALAAGNVWQWTLLNQAQRRAGATEFQAVAMAATGSVQGASGVLVLDKEGRYGTLVVDNLPDLEKTQQYQLWLIDAGGERTDGGVFSVYSSGYAVVWIHVEQPLNSFASFGVTVEPYGGSPLPTGEKVLAGGF